MRDYKLTQAGLDNGCVASGNSGQRRAEDQGRRELQNTEAQYRMRVTKRQIPGVFQEI